MRSRRKRVRFRDNRCRDCGLHFFEPEVRIKRFIRSLGVCTRCFLLDKSQRGEFQLPPCWGEYDSRNVLCREQCKVHQGCLVQRCTNLQQKTWDEPDIRKSRPTLPGILLRALREAARPLSFEELALYLERNSHGRWRKYPDDLAERLRDMLPAQEPRRTWRISLRDILLRCDRAIELNNGFAVWLGVWDLDVHGVTPDLELQLLGGRIPSERKLLKSPLEILREYHAELEPEDEGDT